MRPPNPEGEQGLVDLWNKCHPVGTEVTVRMDDGTTRSTHTVAPASVVGGVAVAWLYGFVGCYRLDRCTAVRGDMSNRPIANSQGGGGVRHAPEAVVVERCERGPRRSGKGKGEAKSIVQACRRLAESFTPGELGAAAGVKRGIAQSQLDRWASKGFVGRLERGMWKRLSTFPKGEEEPKGLGWRKTGHKSEPVMVPVGNGRLRIPGLDEPTVAERISKAEQDLQTAKAAGKELMVRMLTDKLAKLRKEVV